MQTRDTETIRAAEKGAERTGKTTEEESTPRWPIFHVPHDGDGLPPELLASVRIPMTRFLRYHAEMRDALVRELIPAPWRSPEHALLFPVSRLLCDVERFLGPEEIMERYGMGFCYERVYDGTQIKCVTDELRQQTLRYYREHHARVNALCMRCPRPLFLDLHSYTPKLVPAAQIDPGRELPELCIGTDARATPGWLADLAEEHFKSAGLRVERNYPYSGCYVPECFEDPEIEGAAIMLEFRKDCYLDGEGRIDPDRAARLRETAERFVRAAIER